MTVIRFGDFTLDPAEALLVGPDGPVAMEPQVLDVLVHLASRPGSLVTKEQLLDEVWGSRYVTESSLTSRIRAARKAVGDDGRRQSVIATVHGRGYRFVADVVEPDREEQPPNGPTPAPSATGWPRPRVLPVELRPDTSHPFVGRDDAVAVARQVLDDPRPGVRALWVLGEPGIGKTRLVAHLAEQADRVGAGVLFGRCNEDLAVPLQPIIEMLRASTTGLTGDELRSRLGPRPGDLVRLVPDLATRLPDLAPSTSSDPGTLRYRLFEAVEGWLDAGAGAGSQVLVVDDAQWATDSTLQLLDHLLRGGHGGLTRLLVTARDTSPDANERLDTLVEDSVTRDTAVRVHLGGLDRAAVTELVRAARTGADGLIDLHGDAVAVDHVLAQTAGNPLLVRALGVDDQGGGVDGAVRRRLSRLPDTARDTLGLAALVGLEFDVRVVAAAARRDELDVLDDLEVAVAARLVDEVAVDAYRFTHALVRASLRDSFGITRQSRLHARVADAIEAVHGEDLVGHAAQLVRHHVAAGVTPATRARVRGFALAAAARARQLLSYTETDGLLAQALELTEPEDLRGRAEVLVARGAAQSRAGQHVPALTVLREAFHSAVAAGDDELVVVSALEFSDASWRPGSHEVDTIVMLRTAADRLVADDLAGQARVATALARALQYAGHGDEAALVNARAAELVARVGDPQLEADHLSASLLHLPVLRDRERRATHRDRLHALADELEDPYLDVLAHHYALVDLSIERRMDTVIARLPVQRERAERSHSAFWAYLVAVLETMSSLYVGDLAQAETLADAALDVAARLHGEDTSGTHGLVLFLVRREQARLAPLRGPLQMLRRVNDVGAFWGPGLAQLYVELDEPHEAEAVLAALADGDLPDPPHDAMRPLVLSFLAEIAVAIGRDDWCRAALAMLGELTGQSIVAGHGIANVGSADRFLGMLRRQLGEHDAAEAHLRAAIESDAAQGSPLWAGHGRLQLALLHLDQGRDGDAADLARDVLRAAAVDGHSRLEAGARELLALVT